MQQKKKQSKRWFKIIGWSFSLGGGGLLGLAMLIISANYMVGISVADSCLFLKRFIMSPLSVGAISPSGPPLARAMVKYIPYDSDQKRRFLEVGPGTGVFTQSIVGQMDEGDRLDLVEFDADMAELLTYRFADDNRVRVIHRSIVDWHPEYQYDAIISGLPFKSFTLAMVDSIMTHYTKLLKPNGVLSYFSYLYIGALRKHVMRDEQFRAVDRYLSVLQEHHQFDHTEVLKNIPPAGVHYLRFTKKL